MSTSNNSQKDEFQLNIDSAIDDLFAPSRDIEIDPQTGEVKEKTEVQETPNLEETSINLTLEKEEEDTEIEISFDQPDFEKNPNEQLLEQLDQSFMALDWEISSANIKNFQELLKEFSSLLKLNSQDPPGIIVHLMSQVLEIMEATPDELPTTAVKTLQKGLVILREAADSDPESIEAVASLAQKTIQNLKDILTSSDATTTEKPEVKSTEETDTEGFSFEDVEDHSEKESAEQVVAKAEEDLSFPDEMLLEIPDEPVPLEISNAINLHLTMLSQCINRILPLERLFNQNPRYGKLLTQHREIRELFEEEKDIITAALISDYTKSAKRPGTNIPIDLFQSVEKHLAALQKSNAQLQALERAFAEKKGYEKLSHIEQSIQSQLQNQLDTLRNILEGNLSEPGPGNLTIPAGISDIVAGHITVLSECVKSILPMENLFGKTKGYEKLHNLQKRVRVQLSNQKDLLTKALSGDPKSSIDTNTSGAKTSALQKTTTVPWQVLRLGFWEGEKVAFIPEQIAFEKNSPWAKKLREGDKTSFPLKSLRKWPWTKLSMLVQNDLAKLEENQLASVDFPVLNTPSPLKKKPIKTGSETLVLLFHDENGAAATLDGPTEELVIDSSHKWQPTYCSGNNVLIGYVLADNDSIPVLSL